MDFFRIDRIMDLISASGRRDKISRKRTDPPGNEYLKQIITHTSCTINHPDTDGTIDKELKKVNSENNSVTPADWPQKYARPM